MWTGNNLHIKPFENDDYLVDKFEECSNNSDEFGRIYKFNNGLSQRFKCSQV